MLAALRPVSRYVQSNGLTHHYLEWGKHSLPRIILLHGWRNHAHCWDDFCRVASERFNLLAFDMRGRGRSEWALDGDYSVEVTADDVEGIFKRLGLRNVVLVGHSLGGRVAIKVAARSPNLIRKLVLVDIGPVRNPRGGARIRRDILENCSLPQTFNQLVHRAMRNERFVQREVLRRRLWYAVDLNADGSLQLQFDPVIVAEWLPSVPPATDNSEEISKIRCETLIIRGVKSDILSQATLRRMRKLLARVKVQEIANAGHMVHEDQPDDFAEAVLNFLDAG